MSKTGKTAQPEPSGSFISLVYSANVWVERAAQELMPDDHVTGDVAFYPMPSDDGWVPTLLVYLMVQPVGEVDGMHLGEFTSPYGLTEPLIRSMVADFAVKSESVRLALRQARAQGEQPKVGVVISDREE